jgi:hypothetical protein
MVAISEGLNLRAAQIQGRPFAATQAPIFYSQLRIDRLSFLDTQDGRLQSDGL